MKTLKLTLAAIAAAMTLNLTACDTVATTATSDTSSTASGIIGDSGTFTDARDGHVYTWGRVGTQIWMTQNLAYVTTDDAVNLADEFGSTSRFVDSIAYGCFMLAGDKYCNEHFYYTDTSTTNHFGYAYSSKTIFKVDDSLRYKTYKDSTVIHGICPSGWHLPTTKEWTTLIAYVGADSARVKLEAKTLLTTYADSTKSTNSSGWHGTNFPAQTNDNGGIYFGYGYVSVDFSAPYLRDSTARLLAFGFSQEDLKVHVNDTTVNRQAHMNYAAVRCIAD